MLKMLGLCIKLIAFSALVLVLGNWIRWNGRTISDQVKISMSHAESSGMLKSVQKWATKVTRDAQQGFQQSFRTGYQDKVESSASAPVEEISSSERQKLKALIKELNSSHRKE